MLPSFAGIAGIAGGKPYRRHGAAHGLCNAHHLRELAELAETDGQAGAGAMARLITEIHRCVQRAANPVPAGRRRRPPAVNPIQRLDIHPTTCSASPSTFGFRSRTTSPNATSAWSNSDRRSPAACAP